MRENTDDFMEIVASLPPRSTTESFQGGDRSCESLL
ncbi:hypothetical protein SPLC1_S101850 [Arthrospira platensis C1]|nr:hypothetical protein SPLC1_S101850 [Arthrospira platensis C1]